MGSMMSKQQTADYAFRFAHFAFELARDEGSSPWRNAAHYERSFMHALDMVRHSNHLLGLAQEEETLNHQDPLEVRDFEANWQQALNWWSKLVAEFRENQDMVALRRMEMHMEALRAR